MNAPGALGKHEHIAAFDGLRAFAVLAVIAHHINSCTSDGEFPQGRLAAGLALILSGGWIGVDPVLCAVWIFNHWHFATIQRHPCLLSKFLCKANASHRAALFWFFVGGAWHRPAPSWKFLPQFRCADAPGLLAGFLLLQLFFWVNGTLIR